MTLGDQILLLLKELDMFGVVKPLFTTEHVYFTNKGQDNQHHDHSQSQKGVRDEVEAHQSCQDEYIACQPVFGTNQMLSPQLVLDSQQKTVNYHRH